MSRKGVITVSRASDDAGPNKSPDLARWRSVDEAAAFLSMPVRMLREALTKHARTVGEQKEAYFDGILGRKVGRRWKVWLEVQWTAPAPSGGGAILRSAESAGHGGKESPHGSA